MAPRWRGLSLVPSRAAMRELVKFGMDIFDVKNVLELGYDCSRSKRQAGTCERCINHGDKTCKVVVCRSYRIVESKDVWLIVHAGIMSRKRGK